ncbi:hypothetical protein INT46_005997 [Mucor plumbeus]|uniref:Uncharacterized protein n=1 Tax=Mucor plumbeus TaxID=97098 RepID=A0A8H7RJH5_9FUNG|nr:hypothetical protein INT46_005997 [Mucor plumbeus]
MPFQCIICLQPLIASGDHPAAIPCGHKTFNNSFSSLRPQIISPLYLSSDDDNNNITTVETSEQTHNLQLRLTKLTKEKDVATQKYSTVKQALQDERVKSQEMASDLRNATKSIRHMKQIRRVAELDDLMNSPTSKAFFQNLDSYTREDLLIQNRAMQSRLKKAHSERDDAAKKSSILERDNLHLKKKIERLQEKLQATEAQGIKKSVQPKPRRTGNVIVLDDSSGDENSENDENTVDDDDSDGPVLIAESSNHSNNYNRRSNSHQSLKRQLSLLSDNDDDFAIEEHKIPNLGHLNFSRWN